MIPSNVNFGGIPEGVSIDRTVVFRNIGNLPVNLTLLNIPANITLSCDNTLTIATDTDLQVTITITATAPGPFTGAINITSDANNGPNHVLNLQANFTPEGLVQVGYGTVAAELQTTCLGTFIIDTLMGKLLRRTTTI